MSERVGRCGRPTRETPDAPSARKLLLGCWVQGSEQLIEDKKVIFETEDHKPQSDKDTQTSVDA